VPSQFTAGEVERLLAVPSDRISVCPPGAPDWAPRDRLPADGGYVLFFGTLEPRKNVGSLLDAYEQLIAGPGPAKAGPHKTISEAGPSRTKSGNVPPLVLAGHATAEAQPWLDRISRPPLRGVARHTGYVDPSARRELYEGARLLVQPSFEEGFGLPVLEAMTLGVPVIAANRGALPEVLGDAGLVVDPEQPAQLASALERMIDDEAFAAACAAKGVLRARQFRWDLTARRVYETYGMAIERRVQRTAAGPTRTRPTD